jgi:hypothetical protein
MLGIFDINIPLLYGEGEKAFIRLQEEIIKVSDDHTIFCWNWGDTIARSWRSFLAPCPAAFQTSGHFIAARPFSVDPISTYAMTNAGLRIQLPLAKAWDCHFAVLNARSRTMPESSGARVCIPLVGEPSRKTWRAFFPPEVIHLPRYWAGSAQELYIGGSTPELQDDLANPLKPPLFPQISTPPEFGRYTHAVLPVFTGDISTTTLLSMRPQENRTVPALEGNILPLLPTSIPTLCRGSSLAFRLKKDMALLLVFATRDANQMGSDSGEEWVCAIPDGDISVGREHSIELDKQIKFSELDVHVECPTGCAVVLPEIYQFKVNADGVSRTIRPVGIIINETYDARNQDNGSDRLARSISRGAESIT